MTPRDLSPNQRAKRQAIVEAAKGVLARDGLAACTARAVADAGPLTKSAIHYYFGDMDDLVDQAMSEHIQAFVLDIRAATDRRDTPVDRFWAGVEQYLSSFEKMPSAALLWFDYWVDSTRKQRAEPVDRMHRDVIGIFAELLEAIPVDEPVKRAEVLFAYLLGTVVQQTVRPRSLAENRAQIAVICPL